MPCLQCGGQAQKTSAHPTTTSHIAGCRATNAGMCARGTGGGDYDGTNGDEAAGDLGRNEGKDGDEDAYEVGDE
eukprot:14625348-Alexandrium_andersonii.AAC.1